MCIRDRVAPSAIQGNLPRKNLFKPRKILPSHLKGVNNALPRPNPLVTLFILNNDPIILSIPNLVDNQSAPTVSKPPPTV